MKKNLFTIKELIELIGGKLRNLILILLINLTRKLDKKNNVYKHYKGGIYKAIGKGIHTETEEDLMFYKNEKGDLYARPFEMFHDEVEYNGKILERFTKL